jgi:hypothetical protein
MNADVPYIKYLIAGTDSRAPQPATKTENFCDGGASGSDT